MTCISEVIKLVIFWALALDLGSSMLGARLESTSK